MLLCTLALVSVSLGTAVGASNAGGPSSSDLQATSGTSTQPCTLDQTAPPGNLTLCGNATLFAVWRPKARFIAPEGWMNDPQGLFQRADGAIHAGYQCNPQHYTWGNISQCAATSQDFVYWEDMNSWQDPKTLWPSAIYDIRGVFDGSIIKDGWEGFPTTIYTSTFPGGPLGATAQPPEVEGIETQSIAYTKDGGQSWIKLNFGSNGNPVIYQWPMQNLTGFRDPYAFPSPVLSSLLANTTEAAGADGDYFLTISSGVRTDADPSGGPRLLLYRQTARNDVRGWTYLGPLVSQPALSAFSQWSGNFGINFETACVARLNEGGDATDDLGGAGAVIDLIGFGTEEGRNGSHENHWPLWGSASYEALANGSVHANLNAVGVIDWGRVYATVAFPVKGNRTVLVGWTYEDDESLVLARQRGYQGAFTLFRDLFAKVVRNVDPATPGLHAPGSWTTRTEADGSTSVVTLGQRIVPEITREYRRQSHVSSPPGATLGAAAGYVPFAAAQQPGGRHYAVLGTLRWVGGAGGPAAGFRVLASDSEWTDIYFDPANETLVVDRSNSSLVPSYGKDSEFGKLRLWPLTRAGAPAEAQTLNLTVIVDNSVVEVYANDVTVITTRVYPWLGASRGAGFLARAPASASGSASAAAAAGSVEFSAVEVWDGLVDAWPGRPADTRLPLRWDGAMPGVWGGLWDGF